MDSQTVLQIGSHKREVLGTWARSIRGPVLARSVWVGGQFTSAAGHCLHQDSSKSEAGPRATGIWVPTTVFSIYLFDDGGLYIFFKTHKILRNNKAEIRSTLPRSQVGPLISF